MHKKQMEALDKEIEQRYAEAGDEEKEKIYFLEDKL